MALYLVNYTLDGERYATNIECNYPLKDQENSSKKVEYNLARAAVSEHMKVNNLTGEPVDITWRLIFD